MRHPPAVNLQYFLCIITQFKDCYKLYRLALSHEDVKKTVENFEIQIP